jgi:hypothetical protein
VTDYQDFNVLLLFAASLPVCSLEISALFMTSRGFGKSALWAVLPIVLSYRYTIVIAPSGARYDNLHRRPYATADLKGHAILTGRSPRHITDRLMFQI